MAQLNDPRLPERFWRKVEATAEGCWTWTASKDHSGYGLFGVRASRSERAHRVAYKALVGTIAEGMQLDHLCRVRACCNPEHLEPVTPAENSRRGLRGVLRTHCVNGHQVSAPGHCPVCRRIQNISANRPVRQRKRAALNGR